jgi:hypothetical protein
MSYPDPSQVLAGVVFGESDELTGTYVAPDASKYADFGPGYGPGGATLGTLNSNVILFDAGGTYHPPVAADLKGGVPFGPDNSLTGELPLAHITTTYGGTYVAPDPAYYLSPEFNGGPGAAPNYGPDGSLTGTLTLPTVAQVLTGISFGASGTQYTGTYTPAGPDNPADCLVTFTARNNGAADPGEIFTFTCITAPTGTGNAYVNDTRTATSDADGLVTIELPRASEWNFRWARGGSIDITIPDAATYSPPNFVL